MSCELHDEAWPALLRARRLLAAGAGALAFIRSGTEWRCVDPSREEAGGEQVLLAALPTDPPEPHAPRAVLACSVFEHHADRPPTFAHPGGRPVDPDLLTVARVYLPVLLGAAAARRLGRVFVVAHVTQTLDGRIACANGDSQWIGNEEDRRHAHRMRALLEGVLVGANTVLHDDPRLTVRHVAGDDPRRIVLTGCGRALAAPRRNVYEPPGSLAVVGSDVAAKAPGADVELVAIDRHGSATIAPAAVLDALRARGIHSVYLEGGATTISSFLQAGAIDLLQVHVAALLLGSGLSAFSLPAVERVADGRPLRMDHASLNGHLLLTCWPR